MKQPPPYEALYSNVIRLRDPRLVPVRLHISPLMSVVACLFEVIGGRRRGSPQSWSRYVLQALADVDLDRSLRFASATPPTS